MKLQDLLDDIFKDGPFTYKSTFADYLLMWDRLKEKKDLILQCDEFAECTELIVVDTPSFLTKEDKPAISQTVRLEDNQEFCGVCYLYSISLTPEIYDPSTMIVAVKDGCGIGPSVYNPITFIPKKHILLEFSPEALQDASMDGAEQILREDLHKLLDKVLDNPEEYRMKGKRYITVRGLFETIINK